MMALIGWHAALIFAVALIAIVAVFVGGAFILKVDEILGDVAYKLRHRSKLTRVLAFLATGALIELGVAACTLAILVIIERI